MEAIRIRTEPQIKFVIADCEQKNIRIGDYYTRLKQMDLPIAVCYPAEPNIYGERILGWTDAFGRATTYIEFEDWIIRESKLKSAVHGAAGNSTAEYGSPNKAMVQCCNDFHGGVRNNMSQCPDCGVPF